MVCMPGYFILDFANGDFREILDSFFDSTRVHGDLFPLPVIVPATSPFSVVLVLVIILLPLLFVVPLELAVVPSELAVVPFELAVVLPEPVHAP
jgi:hypothetical protein